VTDARFLLSNGANPNAADENGYTPLHAAVFLAKDMGIVELLVNHKDTDVNCLDNEGRTALDYAKENFHGHGERIAKLLKEKGGVETEKRLPNVTKERIKKHMRVFSNQKPRKVENFLSDATVPIEDKIVKISDEYLYSAIIDSDVEGVRLLLKNGADISACGEKGANALHLASRYAKTTDLIDVILETGKFDINGGDSTGHTSLHYAIMGTRWEINVRHLIRKGADPNIANKKGYTPLHYVAFHAKRMEITSLFLEKEQVDIIHHSEHYHSTFTEGVTGLYSALSFKPVEIARCLMENGADPTIRGSNDGLTPFHLASAVLTDTDVLDLMLGNEKQINIEERENLGRTALHLALATSNFDAARFLLSKGADPNVTDEKGLTPLHVAAFHANGLGEAIANLLREKGVAKAEGNNHGTENMAALLDSHTETIRFLIESGMDISAMTWGKNGMNAALNVLAATIEKITKRIDSLQETNLHAGPTAPKCCTSDDNNDKMGKEVLKEAIKHSDVEKVRNLIEMGADLGKTTWRKGVNALHVASQHAKKTEILDVILETGDFDINGRDEEGKTALYYAMLDKNVETEAVRYLLGKGADPTTRANNGFTPFHMAAAFSRESDILDLFLATNKKFDIDFRNQSGRTALHMAAMESNSATAEFLLVKGANPNVTDEDGATPLHVAALVAKDMDIVKLLINHKDTDVNCLVNGGRNALDCAMGNMFGLGEAIVNLLREKMAAKAEGDDYEPKNMAASVPAGCIKQDSDMETIRYLLEDGQDISEMTWGENGANALHLAAAKNEETTDLIDAILETGKFDINGIDNDGRTPLHYAINRPKPITINARRLIKVGADPGIADKNGVTPLHMAARNAKTMDLIEILLNTEAVDVNHYDHNGTTPLAYAGANKHGLGRRIIARLKEYDDEKK
jgi:ankyrin repeat protein